VWGFKSLLVHRAAPWAARALVGTWGDYVSACGVAFVSKSQPSANGWAACGVAFVSKSQPSANGWAACGVAFVSKSLHQHRAAWASGALVGTWGDYVSACGVAFVSKSSSCTRTSSDWRLLSDCPFALEFELAKPVLKVALVECIAHRRDDARDISTLSF
jgi:hypothetical protein